jgi:hypothetical protein
MEIKKRVSFVWIFIHCLRRPAVVLTTPSARLLQGSADR